jgi:hypothetical protein
MCNRVKLRSSRDTAHLILAAVPHLGVPNGKKVLQCSRGSWSATRGMRQDVTL